MILHAAAVSTVGRVREKNEDNLYFDGTIFPKRHDQTGKFSKKFRSSQPRLFGVFDGMGGYSHGEFASCQTAETAKNLFQMGRAAEDPHALMDEICMVSNDLICKEMQRQNAVIGTTASMLIFNGKKLSLCNIGDSPIFRYRDGRLEPVFQEHTARAVYEKITGTPTPGKKFKLTQNLGIFPEDLTIAPYHADFTVMPGDAYLICSDGLTDMVDIAEIQRVLKTTAQPVEALDILMEKALAAGGRDNITAILIRVKRGGTLKWLIPVILVLAAAAALFAGPCLRDALKAPEDPAPEADTEISPEITDTLLSVDETETDL